MPFGFGKKAVPDKPKADTGAALRSIAQQIEMLEKKKGRLSGKIFEMMETLQVMR